jgi:UDP-2,3-diacylglucosamine hydrolase
VDSAALPFPELQAPADWRCVEFISDLHLHSTDPATCAAWQHYLAKTTADAVVILGDLFEVWVGDDVAIESGFEFDCATILAKAALQRPLFFMHGNRDFLMGQRFATQTQLQLLADPTVLCFGAERFLLSHGDALCVNDLEYQQFRAVVRTNSWQSSFLSKTLAERKVIAQGIRDHSEAKKRQANQDALIDLDMATVKQWLRQANASTLIHGHTHRPATHDLGDGQSRVVLTDWDLTASVARAQVVRLTIDTPASGNLATPQLTRLDVV